MHDLTRPRLCLIEDDAIMGESLFDRFELEGYRVDWCRTAQSALAAIIGGDYALVVSDIRLPDGNGEEIFIRLLERGIGLPPFIFITGQGSIDRAVALLKLGAADYITKPFDLDDLVEKVDALCGNRVPACPEGGCILGISPAMRQIARTLPRLAQHAPTILITGESGVGKEVIARQIHRLDPAGGEKPFIAVNCAALTESLLEAELFGHEKGAFTGAARQRKGVFEQADGGTLFLDEIGDTPLSMQVKLLRAIQERKIVRVGGDTEIPINLRLICATHRDLRQQVEDGAFREDLYYRVHVIQIKVPPLRERREDILWFAQRFLEEQPIKGERKQLSRAAEKALIAHAWPGNVRELRHAIERAAILTPAPLLEPEALFDEGDDSLDKEETLELNSYLQSCEAGFIREALARNNGHLGHTAEALGISRKNLWEKMRKLGIDKEPSARQ
ncbi:MAG: sigma-54 dependent transcriptional regulator [Gammaproteobacteria bacterium]|nr:sigma-54 dependent transcriptional regulator [Gammaproteobacteria bacterium]MBU1654899.1 sigma-54 dependent transcriptional regulator [Gammaproteobacteria bacterium]MBU1960590.1 sigma-54 dependent transcriptional regulator [Gammaproteobacteria bacterium]